MGKNAETIKEAENLKRLFAGLKGRMSRAEFARQYKVPGGDSMIYQILSGRKPISRECAVAFAKGFDVPLEVISERLASEARTASGLLTSEQDRGAVVLHLRENTHTRSYASDVDDLIREFSSLSQTGQEAVRLIVQQLAIMERHNRNG